MTRIFLVDDHKYLTEGLKRIIENRLKNRLVVGTANAAAEAMNKLMEADAEVVMLDIMMPEIDGIECCRMIKAAYPDMKVIAFTGESDSGNLLKMWRAGADAILLKACEPDEIDTAIATVMQGRRLIGIGVPDFMSYVDGIEHKPVLTKTELIVLKHLSEGMTHKEIADKLNRSIEAVDFHCRNINSKFNTKKLQVVLTEARKARLIK